jgi:hypothetical protein
MVVLAADLLFLLFLFRALQSSNEMIMARRREPLRCFRVCPL